MPEPLTFDALVGSQTPTHLLVPSGVDYSDIDAALDIAEMVGLEPDPWQVDFLTHALGRRRTADGSSKWAAYEAFVELSRQNGKALDVETPILTTRGWVAMGDIEVGDQVFHPSGRPTTVVATTPVMHDRPVYRVTTTDGRTLLADANHEWTVIDRRLRAGSAAVTLTTQDIVDAGLDRGAAHRIVTTAGKRYRTREFRWGLPKQHALEGLPEADLPLDPYLLGAWLGDGSARSAEITDDVAHLQHWQATILAAGWVPTVRAARGQGVTIGITTEPGPGRQTRSFASKLRALDVFENKHVPAAYLEASTPQRLALLQGLLDTDGTISKAGQVEFSSTTRELAEAVLLLARSLGWRATLKSGRAMFEGRDCGEKFRVCWTPHVDDGFSPFRLSYHAERVKSGARRRGHDAVSIASIEPVASRPVRCVQVASPDGLYVAGRDLMVTHNSVIFELRALVGLFVFDEQLIVYSAHKGETAMAAYARMISLVESSPELMRRVLKTPAANGKEAIILRSPTDPKKPGAMIKFRTRTAGGGRGLTGDCVIIDEVQDATDDHIAALFPAMAARSIQGDPQIFYGGSAGTRKSTVEGRLVKRVTTELARRAEGEQPGEARLFAARWAADLDVDNPADPAVHARTNPSYGIRISPDHIQAEFAAMGADLDPTRFAAERLGVGDYPREEGEDWAIPRRRWEAAEDPTSEAVGPVVFSVEVRMDRSLTSIAVAGWRDDGRKHIEVIAEEAGVSWAVLELTRITQAHENLGVVIDPAGPANTLIGPLRDAGVQMVMLKTADVTSAWGKFYDGFMADEPDIRHRGGLVLTAAAAAADTRAVQGSTTWKRTTPEPSSAIIAATWATHGLDIARKVESAAPSRRVGHVPPSDLTSNRQGPRRYRPRGGGFDPRSSGF